MKRPGYMNVKEAARRFDVSRAKLHRLISLGQLQTRNDPRDERVTLLRIEDLEALFRFPIERENQTSIADASESSGHLTADSCARMDALRIHAFAGQPLPDDSTNIIRKEREKRCLQIEQAVVGVRKKAPGKPKT